VVIASRNTPKLSAACPLQVHFFYLKACQVQCELVAQHCLCSLEVYGDQLTCLYRAVFYIEQQGAC
jgi:hypothetical protein